MYIMMIIVFIIIIIVYRLAACMRSTTVNLALRARLAAKRAAVRLTVKKACEASEQQYDWQRREHAV